MHISNEYYSGHLEGITIIDNKLYLGMNRYKNINTQSFLVLEDVDKIESLYQDKIKTRKNIFSEINSIRDEEQMFLVRIISISTIIFLLILMRCKSILKRLK